MVIIKDGEKVVNFPDRFYANRETLDAFIRKEGIVLDPTNPWDCGAAAVAYFVQQGVLPTTREKCDLFYRTDGHYLPNYGGNYSNEGDAMRELWTLLLRTSRTDDPPYCLEVPVRDNFEDIKTMLEYTPAPAVIRARC